MSSPVQHLASRGGLLDNVLVCWSLTRPPIVGIYHLHAPDANEVGLMLSWVVVLILLVIPVLQSVVT